VGFFKEKIMPSFGTKSLRELSTCCPEIVKTLSIVIKEYDITVLEGRRSWERQRELLNQNPPATKVQPGKSKHNPPEEGDTTWLSEAVDVAPHPIDWTDARRFIYMAGLIIGTGRTLGYNFRWGGNWDEDQIIIDDQNFDDLPHIEYRGRF
jgi:peptidoglycan L-alanyl-D-glutamate endopeptidase CwlK